MSRSPNANAPSTDGHFPDYQTRRKIDRQVAKTHHEHLIIYTDSNKTTQIWQWIKREAGRPITCREHTYYLNQPGDLLIQKLQTIAFSLEEEEALTLPDVTGRVRAGFDVERITRRFYDCFKTEHDNFLGFLEGIPDESGQRWYASVMLNRLMFIYFIQKKGFLDGNSNYLPDKLGIVKSLGKDRYYRDFLCPLFFEGFAKKESERPRHPLQAMTVKLSGRRAADHPRRFVSMAIEFHITGQMEDKVVDRAIDLSRHKYCSVWNTTRPDVEGDCPGRAKQSQDIHESNRRRLGSGRPLSVNA